MVGDSLSVITQLLFPGVKLGMMLAGKNVSNFDDRKIALMSPQFLSVLPDEQGNDTVITYQLSVLISIFKVNLLSPSVFALHDKGKGLEEVLSLSKAIKFLAQNGHDDWMNFVLEASGVTEAVQRMRVTVIS